MGSKAVGMDTAAMKRTVTFIDGQLRELDTLINTLDSEVHRVDWKGDDAQQFKTTGWSDAKGKLTKARNTLRDAQRVLRDNLKAQDAASARR